MMPPGRGPYGPQGHGWQDLWIYKEEHYTLLQTNMKALGLVVSEKKIFFMFYPCPPPGRCLYEPQGHGWQDL